MTNQEIKAGDLIKAKYKWGGALCEGVGFVFGNPDHLVVGLSFKDGGVGTWDLKSLIDVVKINF
jgi:hypothetical protein